jgi:hypothetical protein
MRENGKITLYMLNYKHFNADPGQESFQGPLEDQKPPSNPQAIINECLINFYHVKSNINNQKSMASATIYLTNYLINIY